MSVSVLLTVVTYLVAAFGPAVPVRQQPPDGAPALPAAFVCDVVPRTLDEIADLDPGSRDGASVSASLFGSPVPMPAGSPADAETATEVVGVARELAVCFLREEPLRGLALFSDGLLGRIVADDGADNVRSSLALLDAFGSEPLGGARRVGAPEVWQLEGGRVGAVVPVVSAPGPERHLLLVFVETADGWKLDDLQFVDSSESGTPVARGPSR